LLVYKDLRSGGRGQIDVNRYHVTTCVVLSQLKLPDRS